MSHSDCVLNLTNIVEGVLLSDNVLVGYFVHCLFLLILWIFCLYCIVKCIDINYPKTTDPISPCFPRTILGL